MGADRVLDAAIDALEVKIFREDAAGWAGRTTPGLVLRQSTSASAFSLVTFTSEWTRWNSRRPMAAASSIAVLAAFASKSKASASAEHGDDPAIRNAAANVGHRALRQSLGSLRARSSKTAWRTSSLFPNARRAARGLRSRYATMASEL